MKRLLFLLCLTLGFTQTGNAQIIHHDINPDTTLGGGLVLSYFIVQPPPSLAQFHIFWNTGNMVYLEVHGTFGFGEVLMNADYPAKLQSGETISTAGTWHEAAGPSGFLSASINGNWRSDATDKYIGFRFKSATGDWHYGWLKMTVAAAGASFTVKEWAYQSVSGVAIKAGERASTGIGTLTNDPGIDLEIHERLIYILHNDEYAKYQYLITDAQGRNVQQGKVGAQESIDVQSLAAGVYMLRFYGNGYLSRFKIALP